MPHLGTQPPTGFKTTTKQSFSGDNSTTAFTLNRASSSNTDLEIFVDNIQQEPTTAYSVSGTTLTFTEAPPTGTNNIYVVNRGGDQNGLLPPQDLGTTDYIFGDDISFNSDSAKLNFGADSDITITHVADTGLNLKNANTGDDNPMVLTLQTGDTDIAADDILGAINFQAPDEGTGTDAILVAAGIEAVSEGDFSSSSNATKLSFKTGASEAASEKMSIASTGATTITTSGNEDTLSLVSTDADANAGPQLVFNRNSASPADDDLLGKIKYSGNDDAGNSVDYATVNIRAKDVSDGSEDGEYDISTIVGGTSRSRVRIDGSETIFNENSVDVDFRIESNGDANMFFVDGGNDRIYMGRNVTDGVGNARLQIEAQDGEAGLSIHRGSASTGGGKIFFSKSRAATAGDDTVVQDGDQLGALLFTGADGTDRESAGAEISVEVNGTPGSNDMPGRIMFATTADGAASTTERMRIDSSGNVLIGLTSAQSNASTISVLQVEGTTSETSSISAFRHGSNSNGAPIFLGKSRGSSVGDNTLVQNGDELGKILFVAADGTDRVSLAGGIACAIDEAPGANDTPGRLVFSTTGNSANNISERMRLSESGNLSIGTTTTDNARLDVRTSSSNEAACKFTADSTADVAGVIIKHDRVDGGDTGIIMNFQKQNGGSGGSITMTTSATTYNTSSDYRLKENVVTDWDATTRLKQLKPSRFNFIEAKDRTMDGFLAHEVSSIVPTAIVGEKDAVEKDGSIKPQGIDLSQLVPLVTKSLQEALARIDTLEAEVKTLKEG